VLWAESQSLVLRESIPEKQEKPLLELLGESPGRVFTMAMFMVYANALAQLISELKALEDEIATRWTPQPLLSPRQPIPSERERVDKVVSILNLARTYSETLSFVSSTRQLARIRERFDQGAMNSPTGQGRIPLPELSNLVSELRIRIDEDLQDRVFFCLADPITIQKFFKKNPYEPDRGYLIFKDLSEVFDGKVLQQFPEATNDIAGACDCYMHDCYMACVFHLMRIVECAVLRLAKLAEIKDPKPSWGAVLGKLDKYAFRTDYKDLPPTVKPHIGIIKKLLPAMHAIQHAWRNKVSHVEDKLIPTDAFNETSALEVMNAVQAFMRMLAEELPA